MKPVLKSNADRAHAAIACLRLMIPIVAIRIGVYVYVFRNTGKEEFVLPENFAVGQFIVLFIHQFFGLIAGITFLLWQVRAYRNLHAIGIEHLSYSPKTVLWIWFIPLFNIFVPIHLLHETWKHTLAQANSENENSHLGWWMLFYFAGNILMVAGDFKINTPVNSFEPIKQGIILGVVGSICMLFAALLALRVIRKIAERERVIFEHYGEGGN